MSMKLRVGLIGLGHLWETRHRSALRAMSDRFEVRAVCEQVCHRADAVAREFDADTIDGFQALTRRSDVDAILMLSPQWYGTLPIHAACDAGKAIYCAAALDMDAVEATKVRSCVEQAGIAFMAEFPRRLAPATLRLKELIATELGAPQMLFCHRRLPGPVRPNENMTDRLMIRELIELVDWCHYVVARRPVSVVANGRSSSQDRGGYRMMSLDFESSNASSPPLAQVSCGAYIPDNWLEAASYRLPTGLQVSCQHGVAFIDLPSTLVWFNEAGRHVESLDTELPVGEQLLGQFHRAVTNLVRSTEDLDRAHLALRAVLASEESRVRGARISLDGDCD